MNFAPQVADEGDKMAIKSLYQKVSSISGGLARTEQEITSAYIDIIYEQSRKNGVQLVIRHPNSDTDIVAEIHCYKLGPQVFNHVLSDLTIAVDPDFQGQRLGSLIFKHLLNHIKEKRTDIFRVELIVRESNTKAIKFYENLGFMQEGRLENRIKSGTSTFEADIPMAWINTKFKSC
ncbi:MAG: family N-acetyltransferase [Daejeonella sp.]|nr:family N-acetyltransferase [Daejeonella sp.]